MVSLMKGRAIPVVIALAAATSLAQPVSAKEYLKGYSWNKFTSSTQTSTAPLRAKTARVSGAASAIDTAVTPGTPVTACSLYQTKWNATGDNIWRGRWYACVYGGF